MTSDDALEVLTEPRETSVEQPEDSLVKQRKVVSAEAASEQGTEFDQENQSRGSGSSKTASDNVERVKASVVAALANISYDFGLSTVTKPTSGHLRAMVTIFRKDTPVLLI
jgi:hypothetical protein